MTKMYVGVFGIVGVFARYSLGWAFTKLLPGSFPAGTFVINIIGSFLIGVIYVLGVEKAVLPEELRIGLMVGLLGGFTTFSSFALETARLFERSEIAVALAYFLLSPVLGLAAAYAGLALTRFLMPA